MFYPKLKWSILFLLVVQNVYAVDFDRYQNRLRSGSGNFVLFQNSDCKALKSWVANVPAIIGRSAYSSESLLPLVADNVFIPAFGKSYDHLTNEDYSRYSREIRPICIKERTFEYQELGLIDRVWRAPNQALVDTLVKNRNERKSFVDINNSLLSLKATESDYSKLIQIDANLESILAQASGTERNEFRLLLEDAKKRVSYPVFMGMLDETLPASNGKSGILTLTTYIKELNRKALPQEKLGEIKARISQRLTEISPAVVQSELASFNAIPQTLVGLVQGADWLKRFDSEYASTLSTSSAFSSLRKEILMMRNMLAQNLKPQIEGMIAKSEDQIELSQVPDKFFISEELNKEPASSITGLANQRVAYLQKVERDRQVFGRSSEDASNNTFQPYENQRNQTTQQEKYTSSERAASKEGVTQCDVLAADPQDDTRVSSGVEIDNLNAGVAIKECNTAIKKSPKVARYHLQLARAYVSAKNNPKALASLKTSAELGSVLANMYLVQIYENGDFGIKTDKALAQKYRNNYAKLVEKQQQQTYSAEQSENRGGEVSAGQIYSTQNIELSGNYNYPNLTKAMLNGDSSQLTQDRLTNYNYYLGQASSLSGNPCYAFTLKEINEYGFSTDGTRVMDSYKYQFKRLKSMGQTAKEFGSNPVGAVLDGYHRRREQEKELMNRDQAVNYGAQDFWAFFSEQGNDCKSSVIQSYAKNLRAYLKNKPQ